MVLVDLRKPRSRTLCRTGHRDGDDLCAELVLRRDMHFRLESSFGTEANFVRNYRLVRKLDSRRMTFPYEVQTRTENAPVQTWRSAQDELPAHAAILYRKCSRLESKLRTGSNFSTQSNSTPKVALYKTRSPHRTTLA
jgi:hypothetical protein